MTDQQKTDHISDARQMVDHAELGRLAEAADQPMPLKRHAGWWGRRARFEAAFTPAVCRALLSDNAALRSDVADLREHRVTADLLVSSLKADLTESRDENARWLQRYADVREAAGIGHRPMLSEVPDAIRALRVERDEAVDVLREVANAPQPKGGGDRFQRALASVNAFVARLNASALQSIARETGK